MRTRRAAREQALQWLYQVDVGKTDLEDALAEVHRALQPEGLAFARQLLRGAVANIQTIDPLIARYAEDWSLDRMASIDRNVLRLAVFEIIHLPDIPPSVSIDEAVELAKKYSTAESGKFVNGVLGSLLRDLEQGAVAESVAAAQPQVPNPESEDREQAPPGEMDP
jgi:N utilization substance protein B